MSCDKKGWLRIIIIIIKFYSRYEDLLVQADDRTLKGLASAWRSVDPKFSPHFCPRKIWAFLTEMTPDYGCPLGSRSIFLFEFEKSYKSSYVV